MKNDWPGSKKLQLDLTNLRLGSNINTWEITIKFTQNVNSLDVWNGNARKVNSKTFKVWRKSFAVGEP